MDGVETVCESSHAADVNEHKCCDRYHTELNESNNFAEMADLIEIGKDTSIPDKEGHPGLYLPEYWLQNSFIRGLPDVVHDKVVQKQVE